MQRAIYIEQTTNNIARVLAIAPYGITEIDGKAYIDIDDYYEPENLDPMDKAYPIYNKSSQTFGYLVESWQTTANQQMIDLANLKNQAKTLIDELEQLKADHQQAIIELTQMIALGMSGGGTDATP